MSRKSATISPNISTIEKSIEGVSVDLAELQNITNEICPTRIGVVLGNLGNLNVNALKYLITHLNTLQKTFEYELLEVKNDYINGLKPESVVDRNKCRSRLEELFNNLNRSIDEEQKVYGLTDLTRPNKFVIITLACFADEHYGLSNKNIQMMALGNWDRIMSPPTVFEFILTLLLRQSVGLIAPSFSTSKHLGTKGCLFDFTANLSDARFKTLQGFICNPCKEELKTDGYPQLADNITNTLAMGWFGETKDVYSPAGIVKKLGFDLFLTQGIKPTLWERFLDSLRDEGIKELIKLTFAIILAGLLLWLNLKK